MEEEGKAEDEETEDTANQKTLLISQNESDDNYVCCMCTKLYVYETGEVFLQFTHVAGGSLRQL